MSVGEKPQASLTADQIAECRAHLDGIIKLRDAKAGDKGARLQITSHMFGLNAVLTPAMEADHDFSVPDELWSAVPGPLRAVALAGMVAVLLQAAAE